MTARALERMAGPWALVLFAGACTVNTAGLLLGGLSWRELMTALGSELPLPKAFRIVALGTLSKYIPGPVWGVMAEVKLGRAAGVSTARIITHYVLYLAIVVLAGMTVGMGVAPAALGNKTAWLALPVIVALGCLLRPDLIGRGVSAAAMRLHRPVPSETATPGGTRRAFLLEVAAWAVAGLHLWLIVTALGVAPLRSLPICVGAFSLASVLGALVIFVPDGLGAREVVLILTLSLIMPWQTATAAAVLSRICCVCCELCMAGASLAVHRYRGPRLAGAAPGEAR